MTKKNNATPKESYTLVGIVSAARVARRSAHRNSWQALLMRMNDEMARCGLAVSGRSMESCG